MDRYKFKNASKLRSYASDYTRKRIRQEIKRMKSDIEKAARSGDDYLSIFFSDERMANEIYERVTPELIYKGYKVSYVRNGDGYLTQIIKFSWKHGGFGPYQIEERMQEYYKTLKEIKKYADDSD